jgi:hypothetical protein
MINSDNPHLGQQVHTQLALMVGVPARAVSRNPLVWLNLICLDAPLVALCWQWIFGHTLHLVVPLGHRLALFFTAWLIYLADRFGDSMSLRSNQPKSLRQQFCLRHGNVWLGTIIGVGMIDAVVVFKAVDYATLVPGAIVGGVTIAYIVINHAGNEVWETIPLKELAIGSLFAAGTLLGVTPHIFAVQTTTISAAILFATLCWLNCVSIAIWERNLDRAQGRHSMATGWRDVNLLMRAVFPIVLIGCALLVVLDLLLLPMALCLAMSGLLLGALYFAPVSRDQRTAMADLVLLTPLVLLIVRSWL